MDNVDLQPICPCSSGNTFEVCCQPIIEGRSADTAEALMRSRFSAYVFKNIDFIQKTHDHRTMAQFDYTATREWAEQTRWKRLEVLQVSGGQEADSSGTVEFKAFFETKNGESFHHEISEFSKRNGSWFFTRGKSPNATQIRHEEKPLGRNDPCHCGSGKKYKKCCLNL